MEESTTYTNALKIRKIICLPASEEPAPKVLMVKIPISESVRALVRSVQSACIFEKTFTEVE